MKLAIVFLMMGLLLFGCIGQPATAPAGDTTPESEDAAQEVIHVPTDSDEPETPATEPEETEPAETEPETENPPSEPAAEEEEGQSEDIVYKTKDSWDIHGTLHYAPGTDKPETLIILAHGYGQDRSAFDPLIPVLKERLSDMDVLAIDMRGHGESTNIGTYEHFIAGDFIAMQNDIAGAIPHMEMIRPSIERYYIVGASIGSSAALNYAVDDASVHKVVMLSPGLDYRGVKIEKANWDYIHALYLATANGDSYSRDSANTLYADSPSDNKQLKIYDEIGNAHGTDMFAATANTMEPLTELVGIWLQE